MNSVTEEFNQQEEILINEQYKIWKKNSPYFYDLIISHALEWPSLTFQWLHKPIQLFEDYSLHSCIISANATEKEQSYLLYCTVKIPVEKENQRQSRSNKKIQKQQTQQHQSILKSPGPKIQIIKRIPHNGQVNRARSSLLNSNIVATKTVCGDVHLFDVDNPQSNPPSIYQENSAKPLLKLVGHTHEGYGLAWNPIQKNYILSGSIDKKILIWDVNKKPTESQKIQALHTFDYHNSPVEDVAWHRYHKNIFASCSDDRIIALWDLRFRNSGDQTHKKPIFSIVGHTSQIYTLDFNPFHEYLLLSGSDDKDIGLWDLRKLTKKVQTFSSHQNSVLKVQWSPFHMGIFASSGADRKLYVWDLSKCGETQKGGQKKTGQLFAHNGHRSKVPDFDWNSNEKLVIGSVQQCNIVQVWQMSKSIYYEQDESK